MKSTPALAILATFSRSLPSFALTIPSERVDSRPFLSYSNFDNVASSPNLLPWIVVFVISFGLVIFALLLSEGNARENEVENEEENDGWVVFQPYEDDPVSAAGANDPDVLSPPPPYSEGHGHHHRHEHHSPDHHHHSDFQSDVIQTDSHHHHHASPE